jgi:hypothetical protein
MKTIGHLYVVSKCKIPRALYLSPIRALMAWHFATLTEIS